MGNERFHFFLCNFSFVLFANHHRFVLTDQIERFRVLQMSRALMSSASCHRIHRNRNKMVERSMKAKSNTIVVNEQQFDFNKNYSFIGDLFKCTQSIRCPFNDVSVPMT